MMGFSWTTFVLEVVNFLVLVWILQHFLYRPVAGAITRRKAAIDKSLDDARAAQAEVSALRRSYEHRLEDWAREKERDRAQLADELAAERARSLSALKESLALEQEKARVLEDKRAAELLRMAEREARTKGTQISARLLSRLASPALEAAIVDATIEDLVGIGSADREALRGAAAAASYRLSIVSAYPLAQDLRNAIVVALTELAGAALTAAFVEERDLLAGVRVEVGSLVLHANLRDELRFFAGSVHAG